MHYAYPASRNGLKLQFLKGSTAFLAEYPNEITYIKYILLDRRILNRRNLLLCLLLCLYSDRSDFFYNRDVLVICRVRPHISRFWQDLKVQSVS